MKLEKQINHEVLEVGEEQQSFSTEIDIESLQFLKQMLSKFYSDPIGSLIREVTSNALDSHREIGSEEPIIVSFGRNKDDNYEFSVEDFGIGVNIETIETILRKYGKSTKRNSATQLGCYGLGWKSPIAYTSSFYFIGRKNGKEIKAMMFESEEDIDINILYESNTTEPNGCKVIVPVKYEDKYSFTDRIREQLAYFENVYFNVDGITNDFLIHRSDIFQFSEINQDNNLHICLDNVYYPIDFSKLGIKNINIPIGLRFGLEDGIFPIPNREQLKYSPATKQIVLDKIKELADYMVEIYNEKLKDEEDILSIFKHNDNSSRYVILNGKNLQINDLLSYSTVAVKEPKLKSLKILDIKDIHSMKSYILGEYERKYRMRNGTISDMGLRHWNTQINLSDVTNEYNYFYKDVIGGNKKAWLKETLSYNQDYNFIRKNKSYKLGDFRSRSFNTYYEILNLKKIPKKKWREAIKEYQEIQEKLIKSMKFLDDIDVPQEWLDARKKTRISTGDKKVKLQGDIICKLAQPSQRYGNNATFKSEVFKLEQLPRDKMLTIYANHEDKDKLDALYGAVKRQKIRVISLSTRETGIVEKAGIHNLISYTKFMKGKNAPFKRLVTSYLVKKLISQYTSTFNQRARLISISTSLHDKLALLVQYYKHNYESDNEEVYEAMLVVAEEHNLFDENVYSEYLHTKYLLENLNFLNPIMSKLTGYNSKEVEDDFKQIICDLFKYNKFRINYENYNITFNKKKEEEIVEEQELVITN